MDNKFGRRRKFGPNFEVSLCRNRSQQSYQNCLTLYQKIVGCGVSWSRTFISPPLQLPRLLVIMTGANVLKICFQQIWFVFFPENWPNSILPLVASNPSNKPRIYHRAWMLTLSTQIAPCSGVFPSGPTMEEAPGDCSRPPHGRVALPAPLEPACTHWGTTSQVVALPGLVPVP